MSGARCDDGTFDVPSASTMADAVLAEAAHVHGRDGLLVPSARSDDLDLVLCDVAGPDAVEEVRDHGIVRWAKWRRQPFGP